MLCADEGTLLGFARTNFDHLRQRGMHPGAGGATLPGLPWNGEKALAAAPEHGGDRLAPPPVRAQTGDP